MKNTMKAVLSTLPLILAVSASAQVISILPGGRGNLFVGTPASLPGPLAGVTITPMLSAPSLTPALAPVLSAPAPVAQIPAPILPAIPSMPSIPNLPVSRLPDHIWNLSAHDNVPMPFPALAVKLAAPAKDGSAQEQPKNSRENLDNLFDGRDAEKKSPVRSDRHQSLPEQDLESEIGAY